MGAKGRRNQAEKGEEAQEKQPGNEECDRRCDLTCPLSPEISTLDLIRYHDGPVKMRPLWFETWDTIEHNMSEIECKIHEWLDNGVDKDFQGILAAARG